VLTDSLCNSRCVCEEMNQPMRTSECGVWCRKRLLTCTMGTSAGITSRSLQRWDPSFYTLRKRPPRIHHASTSRWHMLTIQSVLLFVFICISTVLLFSLLFIDAWKLGNFTVITVSWFLFILSVSGGPVWQRELVICHPMHVNDVVILIQVRVGSHRKALWSKESGASWY